MMVRRVCAHGQFSGKHHDVLVSETLRGERIGLEPIDDRWYTILLRRVSLGALRQSNPNGSSTAGARLLQS
jgi:hypothetical protein